MSTLPTTADLIRDRMIDVIEQLVPTVLPGDAFVRSTNEGLADFIAECEANPSGALRRFQVRDTGDDPVPLVTNSDIDEAMVTFEIYVAYPQDERAGDKNALDRDTASSRDANAIKHAVGLWGRANFSPPYPDACWRGDVPRPRRIGKGVDFLIIRQTMSFQRAAS